MNSVRLLACVAACLPAALGGGCRRSGPDLGRVEGTVTFDGAPVKNAMLEFQPDNEGPVSYGLTDSSGRYRVFFRNQRRGAVVGMHTVRITNADMGFDDTGFDDTGAAPGARLVFPDRYNVRSELRREVGRGRNTFDFELTSLP